jgi:Flp pilus assembly protein TadG
MYGQLRYAVVYPRWLCESELGMGQKNQTLFGRLACDTSGASALEFAIVAPVFFMLIFGIVIYGYYFATMSAVNHIAYEAARSTIAGYSDAERNSLAQARAAAVISSFGGFLNSSAVTVSTASTGAGTYAVTVRYQFDALGLIGAASLLPLPPTDQVATVEVSFGGY